jgi:hypothetical protein
VTLTGRILNYQRNDDITNLEEELDRQVAQLFGLTDDELKEVKDSLAVLEDDEAEIESEEVVDFPPNMPGVSLKGNVAEQGSPFSIEAVISNPLEEPLEGVAVRLELHDGRLIERRFDEVKGEYRSRFDALKAGEYAIKATFEYTIKDIPKKVEKDLKVYVKGPKVEHIERTFRAEDLFGA